MNCLEFRRRSMVDPMSQEPELAEHASICARCAREAQRMASFEQALRHALKITPPEGLEARILLAQSFSATRRTSTAGARWLAVAAALLVTVGMTGWLGYQRWDAHFGEPAGLGSVVLNHVKGELSYLYVDHDVQRDQLGQLFAYFGARLKSDVGRVSYAARCNIRRQLGVHLVVPGQQGAVTVLFMPDEHLSKPKPIRSERFTGLIVPTDFGSMAVVGEKGEAVSDVAERMQHRVAWDS